jgi:hypothetical protein
MIAVRKKNTDTTEEERRKSGIKMTPKNRHCKYLLTYEIEYKVKNSWRRSKNSNRVES